MRLKRRNIIFFTIGFLAVAFAAITTTLIINGDSTIATNVGDFGIYLSKAYLDSNDISKHAISTDSQNLTFEIEKLKNLHEQSKLEYEVTNASKQYDAKVSIECQYDNVAFSDSEVNLDDYIDIDYFLSEDIIPARSSANGSITVTLKKSIVQNITVGLNCSLEFDAQERDSLGSEEFNKPEDYEFQRFLVDQDGFILPDTALVVLDSQKKYIVTSKDAELHFDDLDMGFHDIYIIENKTQDEIKKMTNDEIKKNALTSAHFTQSSKLITFTNGYQIVDELAKKPFKILFDAMGGEVIETEKDVRYSETYGDLPTPSKFGFKFLGWFFDKEYTKPINPEQKVYIKKDTVLYASWKEVCIYPVGKTWDFNYTGKGEEFIVPCNGTYMIEIYGAGGDNTAGSGGNLQGINGRGHSTSGSKASGIVEFQKNLPIYIYLGQKEGAFNGGGSGGRTIDSVATSTHGSGASDVRLIKASENSWYDTNHSSWNTDKSLLSRIITAGGGGGVKVGAGRAFNGATPLSYYHNTTADLYQAYSRDGEGSNGQLGLGSSEVTGRSTLNVGDIGDAASGGGGGGYYGGKTSAQSRSYTYDQFSSIMASTGGSGRGYGIYGRNGNRLGGSEAHSYTGTSYITSGYTYNGHTYSFTDSKMTLQQNNGDGRAKITLMSIIEED